MTISDELIEAIAVFANGDARNALSTLEMAVLNGNVSDDGAIEVTPETLEQCTSKKSLLYDKKGEEHYNVISALHKSMRNSDPDAAVYWLARMLEAGEDPLYIARRVTRFASEDVGLADPRALEIAVAAYQACHFIGMPECSVHLTEAVVYMSLAPKSNAMDVAYMRAKSDALNTVAEPVPLVIRNAPTRLMKDLDYGKGYVYAHDTEDKLSSMQCLPDSLKDRVYYTPTEEGVEGRFKARLEEIKRWKKNHPENSPSQNLFFTHRAPSPRKSAFCDTTPRSRRGKEKHRFERCFGAVEGTRTHTVSHRNLNPARLPISPRLRAIIIS